MNSKYLLNLFLFFFSAALSAQAQSVTIGNATVCAGQEVLIPVTAANLNNVGAITLYIGFDSTQVSYVSIENVDNQLTALNYNYISNPPQVAVAWSNLSSASLTQTKIFDIRFHLIGQTSSIVFKNGCEITNASLQVLPVTFTDGAVIASNALIQSQPQNVSIHEGMSTSFSTIASNAATYRWLESRDSGNNWSYLEDDIHYTGVHTSQLSLVNIPVSFNGYLFHCNLSNGSCITVTTNARLSVDSILTVGNLTDETTGFLRNRPNPFSESTEIEYYLAQNGFVHLEIFNIFGKKIFDLPDSPQKRGLNYYIYRNPALQNGLYLCKLEFFNENNRYSSFIKMMKD